MCGIWAIFGSEECVSVHCTSCLSISHRGPDCFRIESIPQYPKCAFGFHRLAIVDSVYGMQPMRLHKLPHLWLCYNGEIYNHKLVKEEFGFEYETFMDGEAILHLYQKGGVEFTARNLDGVFAICLLDTAKCELHLIRDSYGVRPMFRRLTDSGCLTVCSEAKGLKDLVLNNGSGAMMESVLPGYYETYKLLPTGKVQLLNKKKFHKIGSMPFYKTLCSVQVGDSEDVIMGNIRSLLTAAVRKRLMSERRIGCLLSGGLDSSLISALLVQLAKQEGLKYPIQTFSTGMEGSPDLLAARKVAAHIGSEHHEVIFTAEEGIRALRDVIFHLESYDITTVRASVGMYLVSKYISQQTDSIVIFSGEGSDEVTHGYIYFHKAPSAQVAADESLRLCNDLYMYDVLRADRTTAAWGLELRVPFLDHQFSGYYMGLTPEQKQPRNQMEKYLLRQTFSGCELLPDEVLWRPKEAFSDGISSHQKAWFEILQDHIDTQITDEQFLEAATKFPNNPPPTKEAYFYREIFEEFYPGNSKFIPYYWMPKWTDTKDPSARTLTHYKAQ